MPIYGSINKPSFTKQHTIIEFAIKMRQFRQQQLLNNLQNDKQLTAAMMESIAQQIANYHKDAPISYNNKTNHAICYPILENFTCCLNIVTQQQDSKNLTTLENWSKTAYKKLQPFIIERNQHGFTKQCHGDLHLGNMAYINNQVTIFDCIEFNSSFYWIDTINDIGFFTMDLLAKHEPLAMIQFLNYYLSQSGDYQ